MSKKYEIGEDDFEEKIGIWDMIFWQSHVGKRDMKKKGENRKHFAECEGLFLLFHYLKQYLDQFGGVLFPVV